MLKTFQTYLTQGYERVINAESGLRFFREYGILRFTHRDRFDDATGDNEVMLHIVRGVCTVRAGDHVFENLGARATPFDGKPTAIYLPPRTQFSIEGENVEIVISRAAGEARGELKLIAPDDVKPMSVGKDNWQRNVTMIAPPPFGSQKIIVGETFNPSGNWSGVPAHKHDQVGFPNESVHEEIYYFRFQRPTDWGCLRVYEEDGTSDLALLQDGLVTIIGRGYHSVVVAPGSNLLYTFHLAGSQKNLSVTEDPNQVWIKS
ncbi:MAG: 5-deoxy-glucuronate isomerase [Chloroflexi bacterium]|nr:5-deoxy-glucuronate isomerase [Chloroflexota bacterium]